jgi:uridine kinase
MTADHPPVSRSQLNAEHATLTFLVWAQYREIFGRSLKVEHSVGDGFFCVDMQDQVITVEVVQKLRAGVKSVLESDVDIEFVSVLRDDLIKTCREYGLNDKIGVLKTWLDDYIPCIKCGNVIDYVLEKMSTDKSRLRIFDLQPYGEGLVIRFPMLTNPWELNPWTDPKFHLELFDEYKNWAKLIQVDCVARLNQIIYTHQIKDLKWVAEGLHDKKLSKIAEELVANFHERPIVTIAGPSSSNKTTFSKRLAIALRVNGFQSLVVGMDDFYKDRDDIPYGPDGMQDFEHVSALNTKVLGERVAALLRGESVPTRRFDFPSGKGIDDPGVMEKLGPNTFLILEGIHGLNPELLNAFGADKVTPIYVSALTPLNIDCNHRFPTSDLRLIRRMIRDYQFRGYSPRKTLSRWTSVRIGEERNIFPYQQNAKLFFNSSLVYELPVLSIYGKGLLAEATMPEPGEVADSPQALEISQEARRLLGLLNFFYPVAIETVPHISCIREFVGGSDLDY